MMSFTNSEAQMIVHIMTMLAGKQNWQSYTSKLEAIRDRLVQVSDAPVFSPNIEDGPRPLLPLMVCLNDAHRGNCKVAFGADNYHYILRGDPTMGRLFSRAVIFVHWERQFTALEVEEEQRWIEEQVGTKLPAHIKPIYV